MAVYQLCQDCKVCRPTNKKVCKCKRDLAADRKAGTAIYSMMIKKNGKQYWRSPRNYGFDIHSLEGAREAETLLKAELLKGNTEAFDRRAKQADWNWRELCNWFFEEKIDKQSKKSWKRKLRAIKPFVKFMNGARVTEITSKNIWAFRDKAESEGLVTIEGQPPRVWKRRTTLMAVEQARQLVLAGIDEGWFKPCTIKPIREAIKSMYEGFDNTKELNLTEAQADAIRTNQPQDVSTIFTMGALTGMRLGEICNLTWDQFAEDAEGNVMVLLKAEGTKTKKARQVPVHPVVAEMISGLSRKGDFVFPSPWDCGKAVRLERIRLRLKTACKKAGVDYGMEGGMTFHDTRKLFATRTHQAGVPQFVVQKVLGHTTASMFKRYRFLQDVDYDQIRQVNWNLPGVASRLSPPADSSASH